MERELKIVIRIALVFFIFGLTQFFIDRAFVTPIFLNYSIAGIIAIVFYIMNYSKPNGYVLAMYAVGLVFFSLSEDVTREMFMQLFGWNFLDPLTKSFSFAIVALILFYGSMLWGVVLYYRQSQNLGVCLLMAALVLGCLALYGVNWPIMQSILILGFFLIYLIFTQRTEDVNSYALRALSSQFLLLILLDGFKYLALS